MARTVVNRKFGGFNYRCETLQGLAALSLSTRLALTFGSEAVSVLFGALDSSQELDATELLKRLQVAGAVGLFDRLQAVGESFAREVMLDILSSVVVVNEKGERSEKTLGDPQMFDRHFSDHGGLKRSLLVFAWAGEVNYRHFLGASQSETGEKSSPDQST